MHQESWFRPEQTEQNSNNKIAIITLRQLVIVGSRPQIIGPFNTRWKDRTHHMIRVVANLTQQCHLRRHNLFRCTSILFRQITCLPQPSQEDPLYSGSVSLSCQPPPRRKEPHTKV